MCRTQRRVQEGNDRVEHTRVGWVEMSRVDGGVGHTKTGSVEVTKMLGCDQREQAKR